MNSASTETPMPSNPMPTRRKQIMARIPPALQKQFAPRQRSQSCGYCDRLILANEKLVDDPRDASRQIHSDCAAKLAGETPEETAAHEAHERMVETDR